MWCSNRRYVNNIWNKRPFQIYFPNITISSALKFLFCSGGIDRDWVGVPRKYFKPGADSFRCACIRVSGDMKQKRGNLEEYEGCPPDAESCFVKN